MSPGVIAVSGEATVRRCAQTMATRKTHAVLVIDGRTRTPIGWVLHRDVLGHLRGDPFTTRAAEVVSAEAAYIDPDETVEDAADRMIAEGLTHLLVGYGPEAVPEGVLSSWDVVAHYAGLGSA
ncbi:MAG: CBS domain-containing protein [Solirubrobacterales bacterium]